MAEVSSFGKYRKSNGTFIFTNVDTGKVSEFHSAQCCHCGTHWQVIPGSGRKRGWCLFCMGNVCGSEICVKECVPKEAQLELMEGNPKTIMKYRHTLTYQKLFPHANEELFKKFGDVPLIGK